MAKTEKAKEEKEAAEEKDSSETKTDNTQFEALQAELEQALAAQNEAQDKYLRSQAEIENLRRRHEEELSKVRKFAVERFATEILSVCDSLELAQNVDIQSPDADSLSKMLEGVSLTLKQIENIFGKFNLVALNPVGEKFNPEQHQAMAIEETDEVKPNQVLRVVQKGYLLNDRIIRPAMVVVAKAKSSATEQS